VLLQPSERQFHHSAEPGPFSSTVSRERLND
jgi:hypothetical protein